jgi:predicted aldo/keto reductase-like oxidoreductase
MEDFQMNTKKLGFGIMRLPLTDPSDTTKIDYEAFCQMADRFISQGFSYFDTATPYHGKEFSELAFRECVAKRFPRNDYTITDKLSFSLLQEGDSLEDFFTGQLARCGVEFFDYYLLHAMNRNYLEMAERMGAFEFVARKKAEGKIRHIGFSFHDSAEVLEGILEKHPEMEYVQLQINYADWEDPEVQSRNCYEVCVKHKKPVIVMEPVKGGLLANLPEDAENLLRKANPGMSAASWAVRYAASLENVVMVLSGMSSEAQMEDNISYMKELKPLTESEQETLTQALTAIRAKKSVACTNCRYCVDGCPKQIPIPDYFKLLNGVSQFGDARFPAAKESYDRQAEKSGRASHCIQCGQCETQCPQHLPVIRHLQEAAKMFER